MAIEFDLINYAGEKEHFTVDVDVKDVACAWVSVITGDEILTIVTRDGERVRCSMYSAFKAYWDDEYDVIRDGQWVFPPGWLERTSSYCYEWEEE